MPTHNIHAEYKDKCTDGTSYNPYIDRDNDRFFKTGTMSRPSDSARANSRPEDHIRAAFARACKAGDREVVNLLLPLVIETDVNGADSLGVTPLMAALSYR